MQCQGAHSKALQAAMDPKTRYRAKFFDMTMPPQAEMKQQSSLDVNISLDTSAFHQAMQDKPIACTIPTEVNKRRWAHPNLRFLPVRETCAVGKGFEYPADMSLFHYAHDRETIVEALRNAGVSRE